MIFGNAINQPLPQRHRDTETQRKTFQGFGKRSLECFLCVSVSLWRSAHRPAGALCLVWLATRRAPYCSTPVLITLVSQLAACASPTTITVTLPPGAADVALAPPARPEALALPLARDPPVALPPPGMALPIP